MSSLRFESRASCPAFAPGGVLVACALGACAAPSLPPPELPFFPMASAPCSVVVERLEHLDQPSALGFSALELLARVAGESVSPLVWLPPEPSTEYTLAYGPESGRSNLRLRVAPAAGQVRYRHELMSQDAPEGTECADGVLEVPVSVSIQSDTLALDETFTARLEASAVYRARFSHSFAPGSLSGGFTFAELSSLDPERTFSAGALSLDVVLWEGGSQGSFSTEVQSHYTPKASAAARGAWPAPPADSASLALWPSAEACGVPASSRLPSDAKVLGFSVSDVLEALATEGMRELTWSSGDATALELDFVSPASELCQGLADSLTFDTTVRVRTSDGRLSAEVPVQINASIEGGSIGEVTVQTTEGAPSSPAIATLTSFRSVGGKSVGGRGGRGSDRTLEPKAQRDVRVDLDASFRGGRSAGTLTLSGVDSDTVPSSPASAASHELASGRWAR
ncbi:MAG: hypothetical protein ABI895_22370 [Deltaproteobacteria bacterium]